MHKIQTVSFNFEEALTGKQFARVMSIYCEIHTHIQSFEELFERAISRRAVKLTSHPSLFAATICKLNLISCRQNISQIVWKLKRSLRRLRYLMHVVLNVILKIKNSLFKAQTVITFNRKILRGFMVHSYYGNQDSRGKNSHLTFPRK